MSDPLEVKLPDSQTLSTDAGDEPEHPDESSTQETIESLDELRELIFGQAVGDRVDDRLSTFRVQAENISDVLPEAVSLTTTQDLVPAVRPTIETAIKESVNQDQEILAEALFPIIGPATRKAVTTAIKTLADSLNQGLELSLSPKSIGWRLESWRTGRSFAEVVLLRTLLYQVEQVLLIHKETGLMLNDVVAETVTVQDPDLVSSMLTAIEDFVKDSFTTKSDSFLDLIEFGDLTLWIEEGPQAVIACSIRGVAPKSLRILMQETLEKIHRQYDPELEAFSGDRSPFDSTESYLRTCLIAQSKTQAKRRSPLAWIGAALLIIGVILVARAVYVQSQWQSAIKALDQEPGITILQDKRGWFRGEIKGLRDPLAPDPRQVMEANGIESKHVTYNFEPYWSLSPELIERYAKQRLSPPANVSLQYDPETLTLSAIGRASYDWIEQAKQFSGAQSRVEQFDASELAVQESEQLAGLVQQLEQTHLKFREGIGSLDPPELKKLDALAKLVQETTSLAQKIRQPLKIHILGQASSTGTYEDNARLSQSRADLIVRRLTQAGIPNQYLVAEGIGVRSKFEQSKVQKAQVSFRVERLQP